ncbi:MAG: formate dehydrogenase accessory sulfurtransferase FdhD [Deltaproteobacteria bacterium]|nr:formate dehydrogenase accessory sulfurtransferase FdhD [Deltaproteobacteria bacterium]
MSSPNVGGSAPVAPPDTPHQQLAELGAARSAQQPHRLVSGGPCGPPIPPAVVPAQVATVRDPRSTVRGVRRVENGDAFDHVVVEEPLEIRVRGEGDAEPIAVTMRTPGDDADLAVGFLLTEGVLTSPGDVRAVEQVEPNAVEVHLRAGVDAGAAKRALYSASSCGLCGKATIAAISVRVPRLEDRAAFDLATLMSFIDRMRAAQPTFDRTGGLHAAALFDAHGELEVLREDIGRHNAADKAIGSRFRGGASLAGRALLMSGRAGFEIVQKAAVARVPVVAAISAPSSLAIDLADRVGITLVGLRDLRVVLPPVSSTYCQYACVALRSVRRESHATSRVSRRIQTVRCSSAHRHDDRVPRKRSVCAERPIMTKV